jgi:hypothetical protein
VEGVTRFASVKSGIVLGWQETTKTNKHPTTNWYREIRIVLISKKLKQARSFRGINYF